MSTFGMRLFCAAFLLSCCGLFQQSHASFDALFGLCDIGDVISARSGFLVVTKGVDCTRVILAPYGWRIKFTLYDVRNFDAVTSIHDGGTVVDTKKYEYGIGHGVATSGPAVFYTSSNALVVHTDKISLGIPKFNATFEMLRHFNDKCLCPPTNHGQTVCTFPPYDESARFYPTKDDLKKTCKVSCESEHETGVYQSNHVFHSVSSLTMSCHIQAPAPNSTWIPEPHSDPTFDPRLVSCTKVLPATQFFSVYQFEYVGVTCSELNETAIENGFYHFLVNNKSSSYVGECFKNPTGNCTVSKPVRMTCDPKDNKNNSLVKIDIQDNVKMTENATMTKKLFNILYKDSISHIIFKKLEQYVKNDLVINNVTAMKFHRPGSYTNCPTNHVTTSSRPDTCVSCPLDNYKHFFSGFHYFTCQRCPSKKRRLINESMCVNGTQAYPEPSNMNCVHKCPLGKFFSNESGICEWCDHGFFQNSTTNLNPLCHRCPGGNTTTFVGAKNQDHCMYQCRKGQFAKFPSCFNCSIGYYMPYKGNHFSKCFKCPSGNTTLNDGTANKTDCIDQCTPGEYFNITLHVCVACPNNTYQDEQRPENTRSCKACPANSVTLSTGASSSNACLGPCSAGEYLDVEVRKCQQCPVNTYNDETNQTRFMCKECPKHKITQSKGSSNVSECIYTCNKGEFFNLTSEACEKCGNMTYQDNIGQSSCKACIGNTFTLKLGSKSCIAPCGRGQFLDKSAEGCQDCPVGYFHNETNYVLTMCSPCLLDSYTGKSGSHGCTACPDRRITIVTAATDISQCIERCDRGHYLNKTLLNCEKCHKGSYQGEEEYRNESCTICPSANLTTLDSGAKYEEDCVGYCASSPCHNGGKCTNIDNDFKCTCRDNLAGKQCQIITDVIDVDSMTISVQFTTLVWNNHLSDPHSREFMELANQIENAIWVEFQNDATFRTVRVKEFTQGSVISELEFNYVADTNFSNPLDTLTSAAADGEIDNLSVNASSVVIVNYTCAAPLGMENGRIPDNAISSANKDNIHPYTNARLNHNGPGWTPTEDTFLQVDFGEVVQLTGIATQGSSYKGSSGLKSYTFNYSIDGTKWLEYKESSSSPEVSLGYSLCYLFVSKYDIVWRNSWIYEVSNHLEVLYYSTFS